MGKPKRHWLSLAEWEEDDNEISTKYDAGPDENVVGVPSPEDLELWTKPAAQFIRSNAGIIDVPYRWVGKRPLGEGGFGLAGLWEKLDLEGNVIDRMVIKQIGPSKRGHWDPSVPQEVRMMEQMNKTGVSGVVELRNYRRYRHHSIHRIYMEFCPYGDLRRLYKRYRKFRRYLPEPFLWEVFHYLTEACAAMLNGPPGAPWDYEIVHRDIKPGNIFLGVENPQENPIYPVAKLGDFGLAVQTSIEDPDNPRQLTGAGTRQYMAPEQRRRTHYPEFLLDNNNRYLSSCTNVWAVGATMYELLTLHHVWHALYAGETDPEGTTEGLPEISTDKDPEYSTGLRLLVQSCLQPRPEDRPSIEEIQKHVRIYRQLNAEAYLRRRKDKTVPLEEERLYFRDKEIETMKPGNWQPSTSQNLQGPESGFQDPDFTPIRFPSFAPPRSDPDDADDPEDLDDADDVDDADDADDSDDSGSGDGDEAKRRVMAGGILRNPEQGTPVRRINKFGRPAMYY